MSNGWVQAADEMLVTSGIGVASGDDGRESAKAKLNALIDYHIALRLDPRVNGGWQMVPVEPTAGMMRALWQAEPLDRHAAMLAAAPSPNDNT